LCRYAADDKQSLALSPSFVKYINDQNKSWTARVPMGWENARHSDLKRIAGGRLSSKPRGELWQTSQYASVSDADAAVVAAAAAADSGRTAANAKAVKKQHSMSTLGQSFAARYLGDRSHVGGFIEDFIGGPQPVGTKSAFDPEAWGLPEYFDSRKKWDKCAQLIGGGRDQGRVGTFHVILQSKHQLMTASILQSM
jgi:hypothetical protein